MATLPTSSSLTVGTTTEGQAKTWFTQLRDFLSGLLGADGTMITALKTLGVLFSTNVVKSGAYTIVAADQGKIFKCTGTWSMALADAAVLGDGFSAVVMNVGTGIITIDPYLSQTIDGAATKVLSGGEAAIVTCDGTEFRTPSQKTGMRSRGEVVVGSNTTLGSNEDGCHIVVLTPCQLTFPSSPSMTFSIENSTGGYVSLVFPGGTSYKTSMAPGDRVILCGNGSTGFYRAYAISNLNGVYPDSTAGDWAELPPTAVGASIAATWMPTIAIRVPRDGVVRVNYRAYRTDSSGGSYYAIWRNGSAVWTSGLDGLAFDRSSHVDVAVAAGDTIQGAVFHQNGTSSLTMTIQVCTGNPFAPAQYKSVGA